MTSHLYSLLSFVLVTWGSTVAGLTELTCQNWNDDCERGSAIVDCFVDICALGEDGNSPCPNDKLCHTNFCGGCNVICCDPCSDDTFECPDGTFVGRDPDNYCSFFDCQDGECDTEPLLCPNGYTYVNQNPENDCEYDECPPRYAPTCRDDPNVCVEGIPMFDIKSCYVDPCGDPTRCPEGTTCTENLCGGCYGLCCSESELNRCDDDEFVCSDGSIVRRNPASADCSFDPCPSPTCHQDRKKCPDGTSILRDENTCCFRSCPKNPTLLETLSMFVCILFGTGFQQAHHL